MIVHESAEGHATGKALYTDDLLDRFPQSSACLGQCSLPHARAFLLRLDVADALEEAGVVTTLTETDVPGEGDTGSNRHDEPMFPREVTYHSQPVAWVLATTLESAKRGAARVIAEYDSLPPCSLHSRSDCG